MASLYRQKKSRFWWIKFRDPSTGAIRRQSTRFVIGHGEDLRRARKLEAEKTLAEAGARAPRQGTAFSLWVDDFIHQHYQNHNSLVRAKGTWRKLSLYLAEIKVANPEQLRREHCLNYVTWREKHGHLNARKHRPLNRNTIILDLKLLGLILNEAVQRKWIEFNVAYRLGLQRARTNPRAELTEAHARIIRGAIAEQRRRAETDAQKAKADFLHVSFEIAMAQGIRQNETYFNLHEQVNLQSGELTLRAKGKEDFTAPLNPALRPLIQQLIAEGRQWTYTRPRMPSLVWFKFMDRLRRTHPELRGVSFHGTRVGVISRLEAVGAPETVVMKLVNHASTTVHRGYRRVRGNELTAYWNALAPTVPASPSDTSVAVAPAPTGSDHKNPPPETADSPG